VNFKAGGHQGEHKRAMAAQESPETRAVSKLEKLSMGREDGKRVVNADGVALKVVARERVLPETNGLIKVALVHESVSDAHARAGYICRPGGDHVLSVRTHPSAAAGTILLSEAQRLSLHVCEDEFYEWVPFRTDEATPVLADLSLECQLLTPREAGDVCEVDAADVAARAGKAFFEAIVSTNELFIMELAAEKLVLRVTEVSMRVDDEPLEHSGVTPHCFRGLVDPQTRLYVGPSTSFYAHRGAIDGLRLLRPSTRPAVPPRNCIRLLTSDGEEFPVPRQLLRPCIHLTKAVRGVDDPLPAVPVDVECCTLDRVLLFLEAAARGRSEAFVFDIHSLEDLDRAAKALGCRELHERCAQRLGDFESRIRMHRWADVVKHNNSGGCWIVMDGMLLDVEAWLPEHPGGTTIIPAQARNVDCTVFFELYHASRESFQYLKEFYIGEIWPEDRPLIPLEKERASDDFMQQLREYSATFRLSAEAQHQLTMVTHKSF